MNEAARANELFPTTNDYDATSRTDEELVADLLGLGGLDAERAAEALSVCGGLVGLLTAEPAGMVAEGVDAEDVTVLLAAIEIGRRLAAQEVPRFRPLRRLPAVATYLALRYQRRSQEVMGAMFLDRRGRLLGDELFYVGTLSRICVEPRPFLREAIGTRATALVLFHTHPSGDPSPSLEDLAFTRRMARACEAVGVELLDHLVIGGVRRWVSLRERGALPC